MERSVDYYLPVGMDRPMAEYFVSGRKTLGASRPTRIFP